MRYSVQQDESDIVIRDPDGDSVLGLRFARAKRGTSEHGALIEQLRMAGFRVENFRRGFAAEVFEERFDVVLQNEPCKRNRCRCRAEVRRALLEEAQACLECARCLQGDLAHCEDETETCGWERARNWSGLWSTFSMVPDAWLVLPDRRLIVVEVDVTHTAPADKYMNAWWWCDAYDWELIALHVDRFGTVTAPHDFFNMLPALSSQHTPHDAAEGA